MGFEFRSYQDMKKDYNEQVSALRGKYGVATIDELPKHRKVQVYVLNAAIQQLDAIQANPNEDSTGLEKRRAIIFSGFIHTVTDEIEKNSNKRGLLYRGLKQVIGEKEANQIDPQAGKLMLEHMQAFVNVRIYQKGKVATGLLLEAHPFKFEQEDIKHFSIADFLTRAIQLEAKCKEAIHTGSFKKTNDLIAAKAEEERKKEEEERKKNQKPGTGFISAIGGIGHMIWGKTEAKKEDAKKEEEVVTTQPTNS